MREFATGPRYIAWPKASRKLSRVKPGPSGTWKAVNRRIPSGATTRTARIAALSSQTAGAASRRPRPARAARHPAQTPNSSRNFFFTSSSFFCISSGSTLRSFSSLSGRLSFGYVTAAFGT